MYKAGRSGLDPLEVAVLRSMRDIGAVVGGPYTNNNRIVDVVANTSGFGQRVSFDVLCALARPWECAVPLVDFHGNKGTFEDPAAPASVTQSRLSPIGALAVAIEEAETGATPLRIINGTLYRDGMAPALHPHRTVRCLQLLMADSTMSDHDIVTLIGEPHFFEDPIFEGDLDALYGGDVTECTLSAVVNVVGTSERGATISVTRFPLTSDAISTKEELEHHTSDEAWQAFYEGVIEDEPRLPIKDLEIRTGRFLSSKLTLRVKAERGVDVEMLVEALKLHPFIREEITLGFAEPLPTMLRNWISEHGSEETAANLAKLLTLLPGDDDSAP